MTEEKAEYMNSPVDELKLCPICKGDGYAAEGELSAIKKWIEDNRAPEPYDFSDDPHGEFQPMGDDNDIVYADVLLEFISALQSRSTPPPVAGGVVISREDAEEVLAYCNADFIAQGALLNSCVLQTLTAKAIVEGRRCRMGAIAAKLEAALGERNNG